MPDRPPGFFEGTGMPDPGWWEALWPDPVKVMTDVGITSGMSVIDLCCGDGWFTLPLSKLARKVVAIDIDPKLIDDAKVRFAERGGASNCEFVVADAYDIAKVAREPVDHVFLANAFHGVPDRPRLVRTIAETLRPGGLFAIVNWHPWPREKTTVLGEPRGPATEQRMPPYQTIEACERGGLSLSRIVEMPPYHYGAVFAKQAR
jgi:SAM-dependent methyltransferase